MRVLKIDDQPQKAMGTATPITGWTGGAVSRARQEQITITAAGGTSKH